MRVVGQGASETGSVAFAAAVVLGGTFGRCAAFLVVLLASATAVGAGAQDRSWQRSERAELLARSTVARGASIGIHAFGVDEGLPSLDVKALEYGPDGSLWVGTAGGLCRFDGAEFELLPRRGQGDFDSIEVEELHLDGAGRMWIGTFRSGAYVFEDGSFRLAVPPGRLRGIRHIASAADGSVWIGGLGLVVVREGRQESIPLAPQGDGRAGEVLGMATLEDGTVRIDTTGGVLIGGRDGVRLESERIVGARFVGPGGQQAERRDGQGWFDADTDEPLPIDRALGRVLDQRTLADGAVALATGSGLFIVRGWGPGLTVQKISGAVSARRFMPFGDRGHFIATLRTGLVRVDFESCRIERLAAERAPDDHGPWAVEPVVLAVAVDERDRALVGGAFEGGAWCSDGDGWRPVSRPRLGRLFGAVPRAGGGFFVSTERGIRILEPDAGPGDGLVLATPDASVAGLAAETDGALVPAPGGRAWVHDKGFVSLLAPDGAVLRRVDWPAPRPTYACVAGDTTYLLCGAKVLRLELDGAAPDEVVAIDGAQLRAGAIDAAGDLWLTTYGQGLHRLRADGTLDHWTTEDGLNSDFLGWIGFAPDSTGADVLWVHSNEGALVLDLASLERSIEWPEAEVMARRVGTPESNGPAGAILRDGAILLPSMEGLVRIDPTALAPPEEVRVQIGLVTVEGQRVSEADPVAGDGLEVHYSAIAFPSSRRASFQYRLRGLEEDWVDAGRSRAARYAKLARGDYVFEVRGRLDQGPWSEPVLALGGRPIRFAPLWHQRLGVRAASMVALILLAAGAFQLRTRALRRRNEWMGVEIERRRTVEGELARNEERFRTLFRTIPTPVIVWDASLELIDWNDSAGRILGLDAERTRPHRLEDVLAGGVDRDEFLRLASSISGGGGRRTARCLVRGADGEARLYRWALGPLQESGERAHAVIALGADVTDEERNAAYLDQLRRQVVRAEETERGRIARELHDDLSQRLAALAMDLARVSRRDPEEDEEDEEVDAHTMLAISSVGDGIREVARDVHSISRQLHPTVLDDLGLASALESEAERRARQHQVQIHVDDRMNGASPDRDVALTFFRVAQEALQNACRHARASSIDVRLSGEVSGTLSLVVEDDGVGFDPNAAPRRSEPGLGLASMMERARLVGATLRVDSRPDHGTRVELTARL